MPTAKKPVAKKAEPKAPEPTKIEGFDTVDYEGTEMFVCGRCGFDTFSTEAANIHRATHGTTEAAEAERADLTEHLAERAQVTEEATDEG